MNIAKQYKELFDRICQICGGEYSGESWVEQLSTYSDGMVVIEIVTLFSGENIPKNFINKNRDLLIFKLHFTPKKILIKNLDETFAKGEINSLTKQEVSLCIGGFSYHYEADEIGFSSFRAQNHYDTVTSNWTIDVDGFSL